MELIEEGTPTGQSTHSKKTGLHGGTEWVDRDLGWIRGLRLAENAAKWKYCSLKKRYFLRGVSACSGRVNAKGVSPRILTKLACMEKPNGLIW